MNSESPTSPLPPSRPGWFRRMYQWLLSWTNTRYGLAVLDIVAFTESSFFLVPPDTLLLPMCLGNTVKAYRYATHCTTFSVLGGIFGYGLGMFFFEPVCRPLIDSMSSLKSWESWVIAHYQEYDALLVFIAGFSPIPYKVFTILGGYCGISFWVFVAASILSRGMRFYLEAWFCRRYGAASIDWIERNILWISWAVTAICVAGAAIWYVFR